MTRRPNDPPWLRIRAGLVIALVLGLAGLTSAQSRDWPSIPLAPAPMASATARVPSPADAFRNGVAAESSVCGLLAPASGTATSRDCLACHQGLSHGGHPLDLDYGQAGRGSRGSLRPIEEVIRRGVSLPDREIRCVTCHDRTSPWRYHIALPPGSTPTHAVDRRRPQTYENARALPPPRPGDDVGRKPLCLACHALD